MTENSPQKKFTPQINKNNTDKYTIELHQILSKRNISNDDISRMSWLIEKGANLNSIGMDGRSLLEKAIYQGTPDLVLFLKEKGANIDQRNGKLETPLHIAVKTKNQIIATTLLDAHADVNAQNDAGETPLLIAVKENITDITKDLLEHKADPNIADKGGHVPMTEVKDPEIARELINRDAKVNVATNEGEDPLKHAEKLKNDELIAEILEAQLKEGQHLADPNADIQHQTNIIQEAEGKTTYEGPVVQKRSSTTYESSKNITSVQSDSQTTEPKQKSDDTNTTSNQMQKEKPKESESNSDEKQKKTKSKESGPNQRLNAFLIRLAASVAKRKMQESANNEIFNRAKEATEQRLNIL